MILSTDYGKINLFGSQKPKNKTLTALEVILP